MKFLTKFTNHSAYEAAESGLFLPNVSLCVNEDEVHYNPTTQQHDYVEIGGIKWATMNVGANSITDNGLYFQWGDTQGYTYEQVGSDEGQKYFGWADYKFNPSGDGESFTKYNSADGKIVLDLEDDAANAAWGGDWRMPTTDEFQTLATATTSAYTSNYEESGVAGLVLISNADSSKRLFFPSVGGVIEGRLLGPTRYGASYWTSSLNSSEISTSHLFGFKASTVVWETMSSRDFGCVIRGVMD